IPQNDLEWISTGHYLDDVWEIRRLRLAKAAIINMTRHDALRTILESILPATEDQAETAARLAEEWYEKPDQRPAIMEGLGKHDLDDEAISAQALALRSGELKKIDRRLQQVEISSMARLREIDFHRRALSWQPPQRLKEIAAGSAGELIQLPE